MNYVKSFDLFGVPAAQIPSITGNGAPTTATEGAVGCLYMDIDAGNLYKCIAVSDGVYTWEELGGGLNDTAASLLITILRNGVYSTDQSANISALEAALTSGDSGGEVEPDEPDEPHTHSYTATVTTAATCETAGVRTYTCSCGGSYTEEIPATGHDYVDGVCVNCGAADPDYEAPENNGWVDGQAYELNKVDCLSLDTATGATVEATSGTMVTDFLPCLGISAFTFEGYDSSAIMTYALYDADKKYINSNGLKNPILPTTGTYDKFCLVVPDGTAYIRLTQRSSLKTIDSVTPHKCLVLGEATEYEAGRWYESGAVLGFSLNASTGALTANSAETWYTTGYCMVYGASKVHFSAGDRKTVVFYDGNKNYISGQTINNTTAFEVPENAVYMAASGASMNNLLVWLEA